MMWLTAALAMASLAMAAGPDELSGWGELAWGDPVPESLGEGTTRGPQTFYEVRGREDFEGVPVYEVVLGFRDGGLSTVEFEGDQDELRTALEARLGAPQDMVTTRIWKGAHVSVFAERGGRGREKVSIRYDAKARQAGAPVAGAEDGAGTLDDKSDFRGVAWGGPPTEGMTLVDHDLGSKYYTRGDESLVVGSYALDTVVYAFWEDKLYAVALITSDRQASDGVLSVLVDKYGGGGRPTQEVERGSLGEQIKALPGLFKKGESKSHERAVEGEYEWRGSTLSLSFQLDPDSGKATVVYLHDELDRRRAEAEKQAREAAEEEL